LIILSTWSIVVGRISTPLSIICSIVLRYAPVSILSNFSNSSSVKSFEVRVFPSSLSTFSSSEAARPEILLCCISASGSISASLMLPFTA